MTQVEILRDQLYSLTDKAEDGEGLVEEQLQRRIKELKKQGLSLPVENRVMPKIAEETTGILIEQMKKLTDEQRKDLLSRITSEYCYYCGSEYLPCYCMRDD